MKKSFFIYAALLMTVGCSGPSRVPEVPDQAVKSPTASIEAKQVAAEAGTPYVSELEFPGGSAHLASGQQAKLEKNFAEISALGTIQKVKIVSWADQEYPSVRTKKLSDDQIELAKKRADGIFSYLKNKNLKLIEVVNMTERPNTLQDLTQTEDSRMKKSFEASGIPNTDISTDTTTDTSIKTPSKKAHAVVIFYMKE